MSQLDARKNDVQPDQIYYDVCVSNFQSSTVKPNAFYFNESRTIPFVQKPEDYNLSILRFTVDTGTAPVFIPSIEPNQANPDLTIYTVSMGYLAINGIQVNVIDTVIWYPQEEFTPKPVAPSLTFNKLQNNQSGYYNCYSYSWWCYCVYLSLRRCLLKLQTAIGVSGATPLNPLPDADVYAPIINWDSTSNRAVMYAQDTIYNLSSDIAVINPNAVNVYMNSALFSIFGSLPSRYCGFDFNPAFKQQHRILFANVGDTNITPVVSLAGASYDAIQLFQETSTTNIWSPITAIVFTSSTLPIQANQVSTPVNLNDNQQLAFVGNNSATVPIITDLVSDTGTYQPNLVYVPPGQYRLITLYGNSPLTNLDLNIFYRLRNGELIPFTLQSGGTVTIKICFIRK